MAEESGIRSGQFVGSGGLDITGSSGYGADFKTENEKKKSGWRKFVAHIGPGFLVAVASIDPGNFQSDLQAGAQYKYELLWIMLVATFSGLLIQSLAVNLGVVTGKHLSEHYREEYPLKLNYVLWLLSEIAVTTADIPEVLGTAFALNMLFHIPVWAGVLLAGLSTLVLLGMQKFGIRKLEALITLLVFTMFFCFVGELVYAKPNPKALLKGIFVPQLSGQGAVGLAISIIGSMLTPHNLFLQSALVLSRKVEPTTAAINSTCRYFLIETGIALFVAFLVNVSITSVSGAICSSPNLSPADLNNCANLSVNNSPFLLKHVLGKWSPTVFAVALLASGQSTSITGTYAGQYIMQGFLKMKMKTWLRNFMTRSIAIVPSLIVAVIYGSSGSGRLIIIASMILSFQLPYTLIPVLKFTSSEIKMGPHKNSLGIAIVAWLIGCYVTGINVYYLGSRFLTWLLHNNLPKVASAFIAVLGFPFLALYLVGILYLAFREDKKVTYIAPGGSSLPSPFSTPNPQHPERELESQGSSDSK